MRTRVNEGVMPRGDGTYDFSFAGDREGDVMSLAFLDRRSREMRAGETVYSYYYCYEFESSLDGGLLKALKNLEGIGESDANLFVSKGVQGLDRAHALRSFDCIVYPKSSSSLLGRFAEACSRKSGNAELIPDAFVKATVDEVTFDEEAISNIKNERTRKQAMRAMDAVRASGKVTLKTVYPPYRKFIKDFLKFSREDDRHAFNLINGGRVLLIDDYRTTGTTLKEMLGQLLKMEPAEVIVCVLIRVN